MRFNRRVFSTMVLAGLSGGLLAATLPSAAQAADGKRAIFLANGTLGDKSFFDSAARGMQDAKAKYGDDLEIRIVEMGVDKSKWRSFLQDASEEDYDLVFTITFEIGELLAEIAQEYPDQNYVLIDGFLPEGAGDLQNIYSVVYKANEASYLAGVMAAGMLAEGTNVKGTHLGMLGAFDIPVINDFFLGYVTGAQSVKPDVKVAVSFAGSFEDAARGKELSLAQYRTGTAIGFNVAGLTGLGQLDAAKETGKWAIGVNSDQELIFRESDPALADRVVTSVMKNIDVTVARTIDLLFDDAVPLGQFEALGLKEGGVGIVKDGVMASVVSDDVKAKIDAAETAIINGDIVVESAFGKDTAEIEAIRTAVRP